MAQAAFHFPRGFLWGCATASHQVEGNNTNNNWWAWEQEPGRILQGHRSGLACDWWGGRWREDLDRATEAGQNAHRLSIEWSRVQPDPDRWDEDALEHYREILRGLYDRGMTPLVTLHHFTDPLWLVEQGGWEQETVVELFVAYVHKVVEALKEYVNLWVTINESNVYAISGFVLGTFPPGKHDLSLALRVLTNQVRAHSAAYRAIHSLQPTARVGVAINVRPILPARSWFPPDRWLAGMQSSLFNDFFPRALHSGRLRYPTRVTRLPEAKGTQDFLGVNYYTRDHLAFDLRRSDSQFARRFYLPGAELSQTGFIANDPHGMYQVLNWALDFNVPLIITENGVDDSDDRLRPRYLIQHLHQAWRAVNMSWPIKGYFHWTLVDNFEWERGWTQRFGLWELDVETQARRKRPSADLYAEMCLENGLTSDMVSRYAPEVYAQMFPD